MIKSSDPNDVILDPFAGVCSTAIAADELIRHCITIELEDEYVNKSKFIMNKSDIEFEFVQKEPVN